MTTKRWIADKVNEEMMGYGLMMIYEYHTTEAGVRFYVNDKDDTVTFKTREILRETEKAVQVAVECETIGFKAHEPFKAWFPKSQIVVA